MSEVSRTEFNAATERLTKAEREIADNRHAINNNQTVFDIRLGQISKSIEELKNILKWAGGLIVTLMISFMSWSALQQYNANETQKRDLQNQVELLRSNQNADKDREKILRELRRDLDASGTITTIPPSSGR
jgi:DNA repair exonuclease SbcCD ATPase subunit